MVKPTVKTVFVIFGVIVLILNIISSVVNASVGNPFVAAVNGFAAGWLCAYMVWGMQ